MGEREMERHSAAERVPEQIGAIESSGIHQVAKVVADRAHRVPAPSDGLLGQTMSPQVEGEHAPTRRRERGHRVAKRVDARAPPMNENYGCPIRPAGFQEAYTKSAAQRQHARRYAGDT